MNIITTINNNPYHQDFDDDIFFVDNFILFFSQIKSINFIIVFAYQINK